MTVSVVPEPETYGVILSETLPAGWSIVSSSPGYSSYVADTNTYKWLAFSNTGVEPFTVSYTAQVPQDASGTASFAGTVATSGSTNAVGGDQTIVDAGRKGDINGDSQITIADVILCLRMAMGLQEKNPALADLNGDGDVTSADVVLLLRMAMGLV